MKNKKRNPKNGQYFLVGFLLGILVMFNVLIQEQKKTRGLETKCTILNQLLIEKGGHYKAKGRRGYGW